MNLMSQILESFRKMSDEEVASIFAESVQEYFSVANRDSVPEMLEGAEAGLVDSLLSSLAGFTTYQSSDASAQIKYQSSVASAQDDYAISTALNSDYGLAA